ncbi:beta-4C adrenergic receptor-like [Oculina patagonica]
MAVTNITEDGKQATIEQLFCSTVCAGKMQHQLKIFSALNIFLFITAFLGNALILVALHKESSLHPPSKLLFRCLATTDLGVGLITEPLAVSYWMSVVNEQWNICRYTIASGYTLCSVSLLTLTAISVDRLLALLLGLRYRHVVTLKRTYVIVKAFWVVSAVAAAMSLWNYLITLCYSYVAISVCLVTSIFCYTKIFVSFRHHQTQVENYHQVQPSQTSPLSIARYKKAVSSALWVQLTLVFCYFPFVIVGIVGQVLSDPGEQLASFSFSKAFTVTIVYLNSSLNPILYCWKIKEDKQ